MRGELNRQSSTLGVFGLPKVWPSDYLNRAGLAAIDWGVRGVAAAGELVRTSLESGPADFDLESRMTRWIDEHQWPVRPMRLGVRAPNTWPNGWADRLHAAASLGSHDSIEWFALPQRSEGDPDADELHRNLLDAVVEFTDAGRLRVNTFTRPGFEAGWFDWSGERPLSYASVFPCRIDCERLEVELSETDSPGMVAATIVAAAWSSRAPARLTLEDRLKGRCVGSPVQRSVHRLEPWKPVVDHIERSMRRLVLAVINAEAHRTESMAPTQIERAAARATSAWLATWTGQMPDGQRREGIEACASIAGDEAEVALRLAAARLACGSDASGFDALERADRMLRTRTLIPGIDQFAFIQAELATQMQTPLAVGRVAAGACMIGATMSADKFVHFKDDVLDELKHSQLLVGRDQDHRLLVEVFRTLHNIRRSEHYGLPAAA